MKTVLVALAALFAAVASPGGHYEHSRLVVDGDVYRYSLYVPPSYRPGQAVPLLVMVHGCNATDDRAAGASGFEPLARRYGFLVLYPDVDAADIAAGRCWKALWRPRGEGRGRGDAGAIAAMTHAVMASFDIDPNRVYAIGMSSGAFETSLLGADYPDVFAAIGIHSGAPYLGAEHGCWGRRAPLAHTAALARSALAAMGSAARVMPVIVFHGDADHTIPYRCGRQALAQWLQTDNLVLEGAHEPPVPSTPAHVGHASVPYGHAYTVSAYRDANGFKVAELWTVHGMAHRWSGSAGSAWARYDDPLGPSAAVAAWRFFATHDRQERVR